MCVTSNKYMCGDINFHFKFLTRNKVRNKIVYVCVTLYLRKFLFISIKKTYLSLNSVKLDKKAHTLHKVFKFIRTRFGTMGMMQVRKKLSV